MGFKSKFNQIKNDVLRMGVKLTDGLNWTFGDTSIYIVNSYRYLGLGLTQSLSFENHRQGKAVAGNS